MDKWSRGGACGGRGTEAILVVSFVRFVLYSFFDRIRVFGVLRFNLFFFWDFMRVGSGGRFFFFNRLCFFLGGWGGVGGYLVV